MTHGPSVAVLAGVTAALQGADIDLADALYMQPEQWKNAS